MGGYGTREIPTIQRLKLSHGSIILHLKDGFLSSQITGLIFSEEGNERSTIGLKGPFTNDVTLLGLAVM